MQGIYQIRNLINNKIYIGSAINIQERWNKHRSELRKMVHGNKYLQNAWNKYGEKSFVFEILEEFLNKSFLLKLEQYYIDNLEPEYNICKNAGSLLGFKHSDETKIRMSKNHADFSGENNPMYGVSPVITEEIRKKMSESHKSCIPWNKGVLCTKEVKLKISLAQSGEKHPKFGKKCPEHSMKMKKYWDRKRGY